MGKGGGGGSGDGSESVGGPVGEIAAAAVRGVKLMPFIARAVEGNGGDRDAGDARPMPRGVPPERAREQHCADCECAEVRSFVRNLKGIHLLDLFPAERGQNEDAERPAGDGDPGCEAEPAGCAIHKVITGR